MPKFFESNFQEINSVEGFFKVLGKNGVHNCRVKMFLQKDLDKKSVGGKYEEVNLLRFIFLYSAFSKDLKEGILADQRTQALFSDAEITNDKDILTTAVACGNLSILAKLLKNIDPNTKDSHGSTPLHTAARNGNALFIQLILDRKRTKAPVDINRLDNDGNTPLNLAIIKGSFETIKILLTAGADVTIKNKDGHTPLSLTSSLKERSDIISLLQAYHATDSAALGEAVENNNIAHVKQLLGAKADPNPKDKKVISPLSFACGKGFAQIVEFLLKSKADPNLAPQSGLTPLFFVKEDKHAPEIIENLVHHKANPNHIAISGTPLIYATAQGKVGVVKALLDAKADVTHEQAGTILHLAAYTDNLELIKLFLTRDVPTDVTDSKGFIPLETALVFQHAAIALLKNYNTQNLLHVAVFRKQIEIVQFLFEQNPENINVLSEHQETALHLAAHNADIPMIKLLLKHKADFTLKRFDGTTAFDLLPETMQTDPEISKLFGVTIYNTVAKNKSSQPQPEKKPSFSAIALEELKNAYKKLSFEREQSLPTLFRTAAEHQPQESIPLIPQLDPRTINYLFKNKYPSSTCIICNSKPIFITIDPNVETEIEPEVLEKFAHYLKNDTAKFIETNVKGEQGIRPLFRTFICHPETSKKHKLYELKLKGIPGRLFGIIEKLHGQRVLNLIAYDKDPHSKGKLIIVKEKVTNALVARTKFLIKADEKNLPFKATYAKPDGSTQLLYGSHWQTSTSSISQTSISSISSKTDSKITQVIK